MKKQILLFFVLALATGMIISGCASKQEKKVYHVGVLSGLNFFSNIAGELKTQMTGLGFLEGNNIIYDIQQTNFEPEKEKQILKNFVNNKVDLIISYPTEVSLFAKEAVSKTDIPLIFTAAFIEGNNLVNSLQQPGGNTTGVRYPNPDICIKRLEIMKEILPKAKRFFMPYQEGYPSIPTNLEVMRPAAQKIGITLIEFPVKDIAELQAEMERRSKLGDKGFDFDAVLYMPEALSTRRDTFDLMTKYTRDRKIPIGGTIIKTDDYGTLFGVSPDNKEMAKQTAYLVQKVFNGISAGTIPVVSPEAYIKINNKVALELGLKIPEDLLDRAKEIIK